MVIGVVRLVIESPECQSLKEKRQIVRPIVARLQRELRLSAAEVEDMDAWDRIVLGVACVGNDARHVQGLLSAVVTFVEREWPEYPLADVSTEVTHVL